MSKGLRTIEDVEKAVALLRTRDSARARELRAVRAELAAIENMLEQEREGLLRSLADHPLPAANSTPLSSSHSWRARAGAALSRARFFLSRWLGR